MSRIHATRKHSPASPAGSAPAAKTISQSELLHRSGAGAPQPMSASLREKFEPGFGADFSNIRISRGHIPEELGIEAVAKGTDILIDSRAGMDVLGHELAHVVQQAQGQVGGGFPVVHNAALEHQADVMGARAASGLSAMEGGMSGFGGGEMMSIAPMSSVAAPAQCKSKKDKGAPQQAPAKSRGDLFREQYDGLDLADQVEMLRNYSYILSLQEADDQSEEDAYFKILEKAGPEMMDEILRQQKESATGLVADRMNRMNYGDDAETAALLSGVSGEADRLQSFTTLTKNIVMGGNNQKAYAYYKDKHAGMIDEDAGYKKVMEDAQDIIGFSYGKSDWLKENPELVGIAREQASERQDADVASWNQARKAMAAPAEPEKKKHRFRRWLNK